MFISCLFHVYCMFIPYFTTYVSCFYIHRTTSFAICVIIPRGGELHICRLIENGWQQIMQTQPHRGYIHPTTLPLSLYIVACLPYSQQKSTMYSPINTDLLPAEPRVITLQCEWYLCAD